ncbi:methyltransferase domain-containing protein [Oxalobacteraceae bacterium]|nr:methyltransferase domain-containing protein [Oxalobacteraceae bacterium]
MDINTIPVISVSYNSAELIEDLLSTFRAHYPNPVTIIDGSGEQHYRAIEAVCARYADVRFIHFDYNIHHGPGMAWAFQNLELQGPVLVLDSDVTILKRGFLESMLDELRPGMYGVGYVNHVNEGGFDVDYEAGAIRYLHPACMLVNIEVLRQWPMPTRHGAPMTEPMVAIHRAGQDDLIKGIAWIKEDFSREDVNHYLRHDWQGTVKRTGGYHLEEWERAAREAAYVRMVAQSLMPPAPLRVVEIGANDGALARGVKEAHPGCHYSAIEINPERKNLAKGACDVVLNHDIDALGDDFFRDYAGVSCWVLDQALERLRHPEQLLARIRKTIAADASIVAVIPNAQHWSIQARLCMGDFRYGDNGLMRSEHLRWFTRATIFELFQKAGFQVVQGAPVVHHPMENPVLADALKQLAGAVGADPELALEDAQAAAYVVKAVPV